MSDMSKPDPKKLTVTLGAFTCTVEGYDEPMTVLRDVTAHLKELSAEQASFLAVPERAPVRQIVTQAQPGAQRLASPAAHPTPGQTVQPQQPAAARRGPAPSVQVIRGLAGKSVETGARPSTPPLPDVPTAQTVEAPDGPAVTLSPADRIDTEALSERARDLLRAKTPPEAGAFIRAMKAEQITEMFEAASAYLIHFQGYRHVTPRQVTRLLKRAELLETGVANVDSVVEQLMSAGRLGGNLQEGLTIGAKSAYSEARLSAS